MLSCCEVSAVCISNGTVTVHMSASQRGAGWCCIPFSVAERVSSPLSAANFIMMGLKNDGKKKIKTYSGGMYEIMQ